MGRRRAHIPLSVFLNSRLLGQLIKEPSGAVSFTYDRNWLSWEHALPVSLSLPLREDRYIGEKVSAYFENLLPDSDVIRRPLAERVGALGTDAFNLLSKIGRDCVGALQFLPAGEGPTDTKDPQGVPISETQIESLLINLRSYPLGLSAENDFRISIAGAQEKTALLYKENQWFEPLGTTPTTHIFKTQIGHLPSGIDLSNSVENEFYFLNLMKLFNIAVNKAEMKSFGKTKSLVIERFDRLWTKDGRLIRLPQEDCCQALSIPPTLKYQNQGGPGMVDVLKLLNGSDEAAEDKRIFFKSQILFWLMGATDGHAKNFSLFLYPQGRYRLTPIYDVLTAQPSFDAKHIQPKEMKLAVSVGKNRHYKFIEIHGRHFIETAERSGMAKQTAIDILEEISARAQSVFEEMEHLLPHNFPAQIHDSVKRAVKRRRERLKTGTY